MVFKVKKSKKSPRQMGSRTHGHGAMKRGSGHRGGVGMAGTGKRADQKKSMITAKYGNKYFGKQGITSRGTERDIRLRINIGQIDLNLEKYGKKVGDKWEINLGSYKILGNGEVKNKLIIKAFEASKSAIEKVKKAGGEIIVKEKKKIVTPLVESPKVKERKIKEAKKAKK